MPSSRPNTIPTVIHLIRQFKPASILDVGVGFGKWGHLFREYTDILEAENDPARYQRQNWRVRIDGIEGFPSYLTEMHRFLYNDIHVGDACALMPTLPRYDVIFLGDIIEHLDMAAGKQLLTDAISRAGKGVIVSTPKYETEQADLCGNELERHRSLWRARDFRQFRGALVRTIDRDTLLAVIVQPGVPVPLCTPPAQPRPADARRLRQTRQTLIRLIPAAERFILVDDEQLRHDLPHTAALPFLEKDGQYWGPPADDATALRELERMRHAGARYIAFTWPAFWWLEHYRGFSEHLHSSTRCVLRDENVLVLELEPTL
jgi:hypothetical protein